MSRSTFETNIYVYDAVRDTDVLTPVSVEYIYESEWPSSEDDPGEPEVFEICSIKNKNTGAEITEEDVEWIGLLKFLRKKFVDAGEMKIFLMNHTLTTNIDV